MVRFNRSSQTSATCTQPTTSCLPSACLHCPARRWPIAWPQPPSPRWQYTALLFTVATPTLSTQLSDVPVALPGVHEGSVQAPVLQVWAWPFDSCSPGTACPNPDGPCCRGTRSHGAGSRGQKSPGDEDMTKPPGRPEETPGSPRQNLDRVCLRGGPGHRCGPGTKRLTASRGKGKAPASQG